MNKLEVYEFLKEKSISFELSEHKPVFTIEEMLEENLPHPEIIAKNLFVRDDKKRNYYLITVQEERTVNMKEFQQQFGTRKLSFASEADLMLILRLTKGSVTPLGLLNDEEHRVHFFIGKEFKGGRLGIHPNDNTATIWIGYDDILSVIKELGNDVTEF